MFDVLRYVGLSAICVLWFTMAGYMDHRLLMTLESQSRPSLIPSPLTALVLNIAQSLFLISAKPSASATCRRRRTSHEDLGCGPNRSLGTARTLLPNGCAEHPPLGRHA